jgi:bifunctional non-homologous end joining protein LigD
MKLTLLAGVCALATAMPAEALNQPLDFYSNTGSWSGSITGPHISAGDTLALNYRTYDDVGFSIRPGDQVFATVSFKEMGLRVVDYSWAFYNHGSLIVDERAQLDVPVEGSMLTTRIFANFTGVFDVVQMLTKSGTDCTTWFPEIAEALAMLPGGPHVIDGEVCVLRPDGTSDFNLLQARPAPQALPGRAAGHPDGLRHPGARRPVRHGPAAGGAQGAARAAAAGHAAGGCCSSRTCRRTPTCSRPWSAPGLEIEGVMAKRRDSIYQPGVRSTDWVKIKRPGWREGRNWTS